MPATEGPLSFGQLSIWRDVRALPESRWAEANVWAVWPLPTGTGVAAVRRSLERLVRRHPALRTTYELSDPDNPRQIVHHGVDVEWDLVEAGSRSIAAVVGELTAVPFDLTRSPAWRVRLLTSGADVEHLVLVNHHIVADGGGQAVLQADLSAALRATAGEAAEQETYSLVTMAEEQRSASFAAKNAAALHNWRVCLPPACAGGQAPPDAITLQASIQRPELAVNVHNLARRLDISPSSVYLAAYTSTISRVAGLSSVPLRLMSSNRFSARWGRYVTSMNQWAPVQFDLPAKGDLPVLARHMHNIALRTYRLGMYDPAALAQFRRERPDLSREVESAWAFNHITADRLPRGSRDDDQEGPQLRWEEAFHRFGHRCYLRAFDDGTLRLRACGMSRELVAAILTGMCAVLTADPDSTIAHVGGGHSVPARPTAEGGGHLAARLPG
ncbi:condensation domain-containing protein [Micromonospora sp. NPDC093277]|uniref:condensation domain-containing protein n=1 Tax=Micromonospora sp. NPDC093277 TaxID=3364291 RepID=UPI00382E29C7